MRVSEQFLHSRRQAELDFVDIPLGTDIPLFLDPYAIAKNGNEWCRAAHPLAQDFFQQVLNRLRAGKRPEALALLAHLGEDNRTRLGYSQEEPQGTGFGHERAEPFLTALEESEAFKTGQISDIEDAALFVERIGFDIVSDMLTNVLREQLARYTESQCRLFGIPMTKTETFFAWRVGTGWTNVTAVLPVDGDGNTFLLVPRAIARKDFSLEPNQFLTDYLDRYFDRGNPKATDALEKMLQHPVPHRGRQKPTRKRLREELKGKGSIKRVMSKLSENFSEALDGYKERARKNRPVLTSGAIESVHPESKDDAIAEIVAEMRAAAGAVGLDEVARSVTCAIVAAFFPEFQYPRLWDSKLKGFAGIVMSNTATKGVFWNARGAAAENRENVLVLVSDKPVAESDIDTIDVTKVLPAAGAGMAIIVAPAIDAGLKSRRKQLLKSGLTVVSRAELADIAELDVLPELALAKFEALISK